MERYHGVRGLLKVLGGRANTEILTLRVRMTLPREWVGMAIRLWGAR